MWGYTHGQVWIPALAIKNIGLNINVSISRPVFFNRAPSVPPGVNQILRGAQICGGELGVSGIEWGSSFSLGWIGAKRIGANFCYVCNFFQYGHTRQKRFSYVLKIECVDGYSGVCLLMDDEGDLLAAMFRRGMSGQWKVEEHCSKQWYWIIFIIISLINDEYFLLKCRYENKNKLVGNGDSPSLGILND